MSVLVVNPEERPHVNAMQRATDAGFRTLPFVGGIYAERIRGGIVEAYVARSFDQALATRWREEDYPHRDVLWEEHGTVAEVITAMLDLPRHGERGAPRLTQRASSLWVPSH